MRGNAMSREPEHERLQKKTLKPVSTGKAYQRIMVAPCIVKSWLYCSGVRDAVGRASCKRKIKASMPPAIRKSEGGDDVADADLLVIDA